MDFANSQEAFAKCGTTLILMKSNYMHNLVPMCVKQKGCSFKQKFMYLIESINKYDIKVD